MAEKRTRDRSRTFPIKKILNQENSETNYKGNPIESNYKGNPIESNYKGNPIEPIM